MLILFSHGYRMLWKWNPTYACSTILRVWLSTVRGNIEKLDLLQRERGVIRGQKVFDGENGSCCWEIPLKFQLKLPPQYLLFHQQSQCAAPQSQERLIQIRPFRTVVVFHLHLLLPVSGSESLLNSLAKKLNRSSTFGSFSCFLLYTLLLLNLVESAGP